MEAMGQTGMWPSVMLPNNFLNQFTSKGKCHKKYM